MRAYSNKLKPVQTRRRVHYASNMISEGLNMVLPYAGGKYTVGVRPAVIARLHRINRFACRANR